MPQVIIIIDPKFVIGCVVILLILTVFLVAGIMDYLNRRK